MGAFEKSPWGEQFKPQIMESFDPVTQEHNRLLLPQSNHSRDSGKTEPFEEATA
jgi:hypothetical protein